MEHRENVPKVRPRSHTHFIKTSMACNVDGSLLDLSVKLKKMECKILNQTCQDTPVQMERNGFRSVVEDDGFHFSGTGLKRKMLTEPETPLGRGPKRFCFQSKGVDSAAITNASIGEVPLSKQTIELKTADETQSLTSNAEAKSDNNAYENNVKNMKIIEELLSSIRKWSSNGKTVVSELQNKLGKKPIDFSLWSLMSSTKSLVGDDAFRVLDDNNIPSLAKSKMDYSSWRISKKNLKSVEQYAIDFVIQTKSSDLENRLALKLRKMGRQTSTSTSENSLNNARKMKLAAANHLHSLTLNGLVQRKFQCEHCTYQTDNRSHLMRHQSSIHNMFKPYQCYICAKEFSRVEYIKQHLLAVHPGVKYDATRAKNELAVREQLQKSVLSQSKKTEGGSGDSHCYQNGHVDVVNGNLKQEPLHAASCENSQTEYFGGDVVKDLLCSYCDFTTRDSSKFQQHLKDCKPIPDVFRCRICHEKCSSRSHLQVHSATLHFMMLYCCRSCPFYTMSLHTYDWHVSKNHCKQKDRNCCPICRQSFSKQLELVHHIELNHLQQMSSRHGTTLPSMDQPCHFRLKSTIPASDCLQSKIQALGGSKPLPNGFNKNQA